jgi:hypothetical protein
MDGDGWWTRPSLRAASTVTVGGPTNVTQLRRVRRVRLSTETDESDVCRESVSACLSDNVLGPFNAALTSQVLLVRRQTAEHVADVWTAICTRFDWMSCLQTSRAASTWTVEDA